MPVQHTLRSLRRSPAFTITAIATLALGIGATTAIFSLIDATLLAPLPYPDSDRMVQIWFATPNGADTNHSIPTFTLLARQRQILEDVAAYDFGGPGVNLTGGDEPEQVPAIHVSASYFRLFGARLEIGRAFTSEDRPDGGRVVVISHALWLRRFHADPAIAGRTISLGGAPYVVTGVVSGDFHADPPAQIWFPLQADPESRSAAAYIRIAARLRPGVSLERANAALKLSYGEYRRLFPLINPKAWFSAQPLRETTAGSLRTPLLLLFATVILVLLIACSNVANLLLARGTARHREIAIRAALGASRRQLVRQFLGESLLLSAAGACAGLLTGRLALKALAALDPESVPAAALDLRVLLFTAAVAAGATLLFGLLPALRTSRAGLLADRSGGSMLRTKSLLVVAQVAMSVMLAIGAGLMIRTLAALRRTAPGFDADGILTMQMSLQGTRFHDTAAVASLAERGAALAKQLPGVEAVATSWMLPVESAFGSSFIIEGRPLAGSVVHGGALMRPVSPEYAAVFRIPIRRGRFFTARDTADSTSVAVISEAMAKKYWPDGDPIGERLAVDKYLGPDFAAPPREIVGIAGDVHDEAIDRPPAPLIYVPEAQAPNGMTRIDATVLPLTWTIRTAAPPGSLRAPLRHTLETASGGLAVARVRSMREVMRHSTARSDFDTVLFTAFAAAALLLAAVGIYGLMAFGVEQRRLEIGIRLAIGATPAQVRRMVVAQALRMAFGGALAGALASLVAARYMKALLFGVRPADPAVMAVSCLILSLVAAAAAYLPAHRASRLDPSKALRSAS